MCDRARWRCRYRLEGKRESHHNTCSFAPHMAIRVMVGGLGKLGFPALNSFEVVLAHLGREEGKLKFSVSSNLGFFKFVMR